jgi:hypothetical protein
MFILSSNLGGVQICCLQILNLLANIYIGSARAQKEREMNYIELVNEFCVQEATVHMIFFTDFIIDLDV